MTLQTNHPNVNIPNVNIPVPWSVWVKTVTSRIFKVSRQTLLTSKQAILCCKAEMLAGSNCNWMAPVWHLSRSSSLGSPHQIYPRTTCFVGSSIFCPAFCLLVVEVFLGVYGNQHPLAHLLVEAPHQNSNLLHPASTCSEFWAPPLLSGEAAKRGNRGYGLLTP